MKHLNWDDLRLFLVVSRASSLRRAAKILGLSVATVSRRLDHLESAYGQQLIERLPMGARLTAVGQEVALWSGRMESASFEARRSGDLSQADRVAGTVRVNADEWICFLLAHHLSTAVDRYPRLEVELLTSHRPYNLARGEADILVRPLSSHGGSDQLTRKIGQIRFGLYGSRTFLINNKEAIAKKAWDELRFVGFDDSRSLFPSETWLREKLGTGVHWLRCSYALGIYDGVLSGAGLGVIATFAGDANPNLKAVFRDIPELAQDIWLTTHASISQSARIIAISDIIINAISNKSHLLNLQTL